jgi:hypothetical protein
VQGKAMQMMLEKAELMCKERLAKGDRLLMTSGFIKGSQYRFPITASFLHLHLLPG